MTHSKFQNLRAPRAAAVAPNTAKRSQTPQPTERLVLRPQDAHAAIYEIHANGCFSKKDEICARDVRALLAGGAITARSEGALTVVDMTPSVYAALAAASAANSPKRKSEKRHDSIIERMGRNHKIFDRSRIKTAQRFLTDYEQGQSGPGLTATHQTKIKTSRSAGSGPSVAAWEARDRAERALAALPPPMAEIIRELCVQEKSYGAVEKERAWPQGAAAAVLGEALSCLKCVYDGPAAQGPQRAKTTAAWRAR